MKNAVLLTLAGVFIISLITLGIAYAMPTAARDESSSETESFRSVVEQEYLLRAYEGKLAVFTKDLVIPDLVFDVYVRTLPEADQEQLQRGIWVTSYEKLTELVEDYIS